MGSFAFSVPKAVHDRIAERFGVEGARWATDLPRLVTSLCAELDLQLQEALPGSFLSVLLAGTRDGRPVVLKLAFPEGQMKSELALLRLARGYGYVRLLHDDPSRGFALLERLDGTLERSGMSPMDQVQVMCDVLKRAWRPATDGLGFSTCFDVRSTEIGLRQRWQETGAPSSKRVLEEALYARKLVEEISVMDTVGPGDMHNMNVMRRPPISGRADPTPTEWVAIDPLPLILDRAYDLGLIMRMFPDEYLHGAPMTKAQERAAFMADATAVNVDLIQQWGVVHRFELGVWAIEIGEYAWGKKMLAASEALAASSTTYYLT